MSALRPTAYATWASGPSGYVVQPIQADANQGFLPTGIARSSYMNWLLGIGGQWQQYLDQAVAVGAFGDYSDGNLNFDGVSTGAVMGFSGGLATGPSGNAYKLVRDMHGADVAVASGIELQVGGYRIFARRLAATGSGRITANGPTGGLATGVLGGLPPAVISGTVGGGGRGGTGGPSSSASGVGWSGGGVTGYGGQGGDAFFADGGRVKTPDASLGSPRSLGGYKMGMLIGAGMIAIFQGGGGGGGGFGGPGGGGAGGQGGGVLAVAARSLAVGPTGFRCFGGGGASGFSGGQGAGGGGGVAALAFIDNELNATYVATNIARPGGGISTGTFGTVFVSTLP